LAPHGPGVSRSGSGRAVLPPPKASVNAVVGYGYFAHFTLLPITQAWVTFERRNGDLSFSGFLNRIAEYRGETPLETAQATKPVGCIVLREATFLKPDDWLA
jgi:hypothetical protein